MGVPLDRDINDISELTEQEKEDMHRRYPREDAGEGWFGRACAEEIINKFFQAASLNPFPDETVRIDSTDPVSKAQEL